MIVHLVDGTYELFRHFYGLRRFTKGADRPLGAVVGVLQSVLEIIERGETHVGVGEMRRRRERVVGLELDHRPDRDAHRRERLLERMELRP